jgi:hypothetical protein
MPNTLKKIRPNAEEEERTNLLLSLFSFSSSSACCLLILSSISRSRCAVSTGFALPNMEDFEELVVLVVVGLATSSPGFVRGLRLSRGLSLGPSSEIHMFIRACPLKYAGAQTLQKFVLLKCVMLGAQFTQINIKIIKNNIFFEGVKDPSVLHLYKTPLHTLKYNQKSCIKQCA